MGNSPGRDKLYWKYWGKARPGQHGADRYHLLPYHCLDVAACGRYLLQLPALGLKQLAKDLGWPQGVVESLVLFFLALHDIGKFSRSFQKLAPELSPELVDTAGARPYDLRHDTLGWVVWIDRLCRAFPSPRLPAPDKEFWCIWMRAVVGHHGVPPKEYTGGGLLELKADPYFLKDDQAAVEAFVFDAAALLLPDEIPVPTRQQAGLLRRHSWRLAGLAVLADWLGSDQAHFTYQTAAQCLAEYWRSTALPRAERAVRQAGLSGSPVNHRLQPFELFDYLQEPTPLQHYAAEVSLETGPQLFLLEDVTGAGKTEAAVILTQRLMQAGLADGVYLGLPSMATANQMYRRMSGVYRRLFALEAHPSLMLAHGARELVDSFRHSVLRSGEQLRDRQYGDNEASASAQCNAWLADNRKKALLADVGVGTLDQALLAVLPVRHQALRLLGLAGKVLVVDEAHSYDAYMLGLLKKLLQAHAAQGGSVILLSATLSLKVRAELMDAYRTGLGLIDGESTVDARYPLAIQAGQRILVHACDTRPQLRRQVSVVLLHDEASVIALVLEAVAGGRCIAWIRNTVSDALRACVLLLEQLPVDCVHLFHSRYAMGHRLNIEEAVLARFGKTSTSGVRRGQVLIGTQVLEQSLDFDVDLMVTDLAPIDLVIQRAGRLQRHARDPDGNPAADGNEQREPPVLYVLSPEPVSEPLADWYAALFPKARYVYPNAVALWRTARVLLRSPCIVTPGDSEPGAVRKLVEGVYGEGAEEVPDRLQRASNEQMGKDLAVRSQADFNALNISQGYCVGSSLAHWYEEGETPTRLGDETLTLYLARVKDGELQPLIADPDFPWEQSAVRVRATLAEKLSPEWESRYGAAIERLRERYILLAAPAFILPLLEEGAVLKAEIVGPDQSILMIWYDEASGLRW